MSDDENLDRILQLKEKVESGQELSADEEAFLDQMAADPNYDLSVEEKEEETEEYED